MGRKKKSPGRRAPKERRPRINAAGAVGMLIGLLLIGSGIYSGAVDGKMGGYWVAGLGVCFTAAVGWGVFRKR